MRKLNALAALLFALALVVLLPGTASAFPACDSFGQDWSITLGPYGGTFPGTRLVTGCRDCNASLGCGGSLPLDGAVVFTSGSNQIWSVTAYKPTASTTCVSTHWTGVKPPGSSTVGGNVSNEIGPFGPFTLALGVACREAPGGADPSVQ